MADSTVVRRSSCSHKSASSLNAIQNGVLLAVVRLLTKAPTTQRQPESFLALLQTNDVAERLKVSQVAVDGGRLVTDARGKRGSYRSR